MVSFSEPAGRRELYRILGLALRTGLPGSGKSLSLYGTSSYFLLNRMPYLEDWTAHFPIFQAAKANALLESGQVTGNVVLVSPEPEEYL